MAVTRQRFKNLANRFIYDTFADFNKSFSFEVKQMVDDGQGGYDISWSTAFNVIGFVKPESLSKTTLDDHIKSKHIKEFSFEDIAGVNEEMRILYDGEYYNIHTVERIQDTDVWTKVLAERDVAT